MNSKTSINIRMDHNVKMEAQKLFSEFGMDMTTAINLFLRQSIREQRILFEIVRIIKTAASPKEMDVTNRLQDCKTAIF